MRSNLNKNQHSVYVLTLSFGVGLLNIVEKWLMRIFLIIWWLFLIIIGQMYDIAVEEANWEADHIHILFEASPSTNIG